MSRNAPCSKLAGNGVALVRERALASAVQRSLERLYQLDRVVDVEAFVMPAERGEREALFVRQCDDGIELGLRLPALGRHEFDAAHDADLDPLCQIIEGVSHFVYLSDRATAGIQATQLELELQAEVDKYVVLAAALGGIDSERSARLRTRLYHEVTFADDAATEKGQRYRLANDVAGRFARQLERAFIATRRYRELHAALRTFYRMGQEEKLRAGRDA